MALNEIIFDVRIICTYYCCYLYWNEHMLYLWNKQKFKANYERPSMQGGFCQAVLLIVCTA